MICNFHSEASDDFNLINCMKNTQTSKMFKKILFLSALLFFVITLVQTGDFVPECGVKLRSNESRSKLAQCHHPASRNYSDPKTCCQLWEFESCQAAVRSAFPECKAIAFIMSVYYEELKQQSCDPFLLKCAHNPTNDIARGVYENIFEPLNHLYMHVNIRCTFNTEMPLFHCKKPFDSMLDGKHSFVLPDRELCCSQLSFVKCAKEAFANNTDCNEGKRELVDIWKVVEANIAKKGCPVGKFVC